MLLLFLSQLFLGLGGSLLTTLLSRMNHSLPLPPLVLPLFVLWFFTSPASYKLCVGMDDF